MKNNAEALKMPHLSKLITGVVKEWSLMAQEIIILLSGRSRAHKKERKLWTCQELLLLCSDVEVSRSPTVRNLLRGWKSQQKRLRFDFDGGSLPKHLTIEQTVSLYLGDTHLPEQQQIHLRRFLANRGIKTIQHLTNGDQNWIDLNCLNRTTY